MGEIPGFLINRRNDKSSNHKEVDNLIGTLVS